MAGESSKRGDDDLPAMLESAIYKLWSVVDDLAGVCPPDRRYFRVSIFGSARVRQGDALYGEVKRLAAKLAALGCDIVTGGGPGLMQAANEGENLGDPKNRTRSIGIRVELPFEQGANPYVEKLFDHGTFFSRLHQFVRLSNAFVVVGGGIGTTLESLMIWQLLQVGHMEDVPLVLVGEMWPDLVAWARRHMLGGTPAFADAKDLDLVRCVPTIDEAVRIVEEHKARHAARREA